MSTVGFPPAQAGSSSTQTQTELQRPWPSTAIEAASHGAIAFCQLYYETYDEPSRRSTEIPLLYHPTAKIIWNGNSVPSVPADLARWLEAMPMSRHDLQSLDCHPIDSPDPTAPPDLIINVTGSLFSGPGVYPSHNPAERQPPQPRDKPRKFHEMFILRAMEGEGGMQPKYRIQSSNFRYIG